MGFSTCNFIYTAAKDTKILLMLNRDIQCLHFKTKEQQEKGNTNQIEDLVLTGEYYIDVFSSKKINVKPVPYNNLDYFLIGSVPVCVFQSDYSPVHDIHDLNPAIFTTFSHDMENLVLGEKLSGFQSDKQIKDDLLHKLAYERGMAEVVLIGTHGEGNYVSVAGLDNEYLNSLFFDAMTREGVKDSKPASGLATILFDRK